MEYNKIPKRQETLGPASPIQDWEVERATVLLDLEESREKVKRLEKQIEIDRQTYEKNTSSLYKEVKLKESFMEKKLKDVEEQLMRQVLELQREIDDEKAKRQEEIQRLKDQQDIVMEAEDKKYQRRLISLQERLNAKDKEYTEILQRQNEGGDELLIEALKSELAKEKSKNKQLETELSISSQKIKEMTVESNQTELESLCNQLKQNLSTARTDLTQYESKHQDYLQTIQSLKLELEASRRQTDQHKKRLYQVTSTFDAQTRELTEKFMSDAQRSQMTHQAQLQNLQSDHTELLREIRDQHQTELEVLQIQHQTVLDELRRDLTFRQEEAIRDLNREWKDKTDDLQASLSKDAIAIQAHWESKLEELKVGYDAKTLRLQGEMAVVKDRLGKEIERRKAYQAQWVEGRDRVRSLERALGLIELDHQLVLKKYTKLEKETADLQSQYRLSYRLAKEVIETISPHYKIDSYSNLSDLLQIAIRQVSISSINLDTNYQDSMFDTVFYT